MSTMAWVDSDRDSDYVRATLDLAGTTLKVIGSRYTGVMLWSWSCDAGAIGNGQADDEASAKAAALAAFDVWLAELVAARSAVSPGPR